LLGGRSLSAGDDGARVTHAPPRGRGLTGNETDHRLLERRLDIRGGLLLGRAADFADHDDGLGIRVVGKQLQRVDVGGTDERVAPMPMQVVWPMPTFESWW